jgi:acyl-CoA thioesterase
MQTGRLSKEDFPVEKFFKKPKAPFENFLGVKIINVAQDYALIKLPFKEDFTNPHNSLHGGVIVSLADTAAAIALSTCHEDGNFFTVKLKVEFKNQAKEDIFAEARITNNKKSLYFIETNVFTKDKKSVAKTEAIFFVPPVKDHRNLESQ